MLVRQHQAVAFGARIANRHGVHVREPRQHATVKQRQRHAMLTAIPQQTGGDANVLGKAFGADVQVPPESCHVQDLDIRPESLPRRWRRRPSAVGSR